MMKKINTLTLIMALTSLSVACVSEDSTLSAGSETLVPVVFSTSGEMTKTNFSKGEVLWEDTDAVSLFSGQEFGTKTSLAVNSVTEDGRIATFEGLAAENSSSYMAVYPDAETNVCNGSTLAVNIPSQQNAVEGGFMSGANTAVAVSEDKSLVFKNVGALVGICFGESDASSESVTVRVKKADSGFFGLTGSVSVSVESDVPVTSEGSADYVTLLAPEGGFKAGAVYYAVVCPGNYDGFELSFVKDGITVRKYDASSCTLERSSSIKIGPVFSVPEGIPETLTVNLDFAQGWPFAQPCMAEGSQAATGEKYTYRYDYQEGGESRTLELEFAINSGVKQTSTYSYDNDVNDGNGRAFCYKYTSGTDTGYGYIKFPVVEGKYLQSVALVHRTPIPDGATGNNLNGFYFTLQPGGFPSSKTPTATSTRVKAGEELLISFPTSSFESELGQYYCLRVRFKDIEFERITLVYSNSKPSHEIALPEGSHLYAHRGRWSKDESGSFIIPENSLHGIREAALMGYEGVECDVKCLTKDGKMIMNHDYTLDRTMRNASDYSEVTGDVRLDALTLAEIRNNYVLESTIPEFRIAPPTLEEFLNECKEYGIKPMLHSSYPQAYALAAEIMGDNWVCFSGDYEKVKAVREYSNCTILWSVSSGTPEEIIAKLEAIGGDCGISSMEYSLYTSEFVGAIRDAGYHVQCSVFSAGEEKKAIANGVNYILTDRILPEGYDENGSVLDNPGDHIITPLPDDTADSELPDEVVLELRFNGNWPFVEDRPEYETAFIDKTYTYAYEYTFNGKQLSESFDFVFANKDFKLYDNSLRPEKSARITLPGIPDRYLKSVYVEVNNSYTKTFTISNKSWEKIAEGSSIKDAPGEIVFPVGEVNTVCGAGHYLYFTSNTTYISLVRLTYTKAEPVVE